MEEPLSMGGKCFIMSAIGSLKQRRRGRCQVKNEFVFYKRNLPLDLLGMPMDIKTCLRWPNTVFARTLANAIHRKKKDGGCTFYHNTLQTKLSPLGI